MNTGKSNPPKVYSAISAITAELARTGIAKTQVNKEERYRYRGLDDVMQVLAPLLSRHKLCVLPRVLRRTEREREGAANAMLLSVTLSVAFDLVSARDGSIHVIEACGEALDHSDKATAKAMSAAWKQAMLQVFCVPSGEADADSRTHQLGQVGQHTAEPVQGWEQWTRDIREMIAGCCTPEAVSRVQHTYRVELRALSKAHPGLFASIGDEITAKRATFPSSAQTSEVSGESDCAKALVRGNGSPLPSLADQPTGKTSGARSKSATTPSSAMTPDMAAARANNA